MKTIMIQGVPYTVSGEAVYIHGTQVQIGTYKNEALTLFNNWDKAEEVIKVIAYWNRLYGYALLLVTDEYPSFSLS